MDNDHNELNWESAPCDGCGSNDTELIFEGPDRLEFLPGKFCMVRCTQCGLYRQEPRLAWDSLKHYYPADYPSHPHLLKHEPSRVRRLDKRYGPWKRLRAISKYQSQGKMLEVGCGTGHFLEEVLRTKRWEVEGIEPSTFAADYARENLKVPIHNDLFGNINLPEQDFDVVVFWNVLEHLASPIKDLQKASRLVKNGGWVVASVPNIESWDAKLFGQYWVGWDLPRHLYLFPQPNLRQIFESIGFQIVEMRSISTSYALLGHDIDFWSQSWQDRFPQRQKFLRKLYNSLPVRLGLSLPLGLSDRLNKSTILTVFAQKR